MTVSRVLFWSHVFVTLFVSNTLGKLVQLLPLNFQNRWTSDSTSGISPWPQPAVGHRARFAVWGTERGLLCLAALVLINFSFYPPCKGGGLDTCYSATYMSQTRDQQRFTISEVAADYHEPMVPQRIM